MKVTIQVRFRDSGLIAPRSYICDGGVPTAQDLLLWFAADNNLDHTATLSCFGVYRSLKNSIPLPYEQPAFSVSEKFTWIFSRNPSVTLFIGFLRNSRLWDPRAGLSDTKLNAMVFCELRHKYFSRHPGIAHAKQAKILSSLAALLYLAQQQYLALSTSSKHTLVPPVPSSPNSWSPSDLLPYSCLKSYSDATWKKSISESIHLLSTQGPSEGRIVSWVTLLMVAMPFSFWRSAFQVDYLQLTGMTPTKEFMIRSTRYRLVVSLGIDGLYFEWPGSKKEDQFLKKWNDVNVYSVLEGSPGLSDGPPVSERAYFPLDWILSIRLLTIPALLTRSDTSSSQVFLHEEESDWFSSSMLSQSSIVQPQAGAFNVPSRSISRQPAPSPVSAAPILRSTKINMAGGSDYIILYVRVLAPISNSDRSISSLILLKMRKDDYAIFYPLYEHYRDYNYAEYVRYAWNALNIPFIHPEYPIKDDTIYVELSMSFPTNDLAVASSNSSGIFKAADGRQIWAFDPTLPCVRLLDLVCEYYGLSASRPLFGLLSGNRWLALHLPLNRQGYHFMNDSIVFCLRWVAPIPVAYLERPDLIRRPDSIYSCSLVNVSFCHIVELISKASVALDRRTVIRICAAYVQLLEEQKCLPELLTGSEDPAAAIMGSFPGMTEMDEVLKKHCPIWKEVRARSGKPRGGRPSYESLLREVYTTWRALTTQTSQYPDYGWVERGNIVNMFEKKAGLYFSWKPNYHRIGISASGWALQRRGQLLRQIVYFSSEKSGQWKCICNGLHIQFSQISGTLFLNDSYAMFALHSITIALAIQESFQLHRWLEQMTGKYFMNAGGESIHSSTSMPALNELDINSDLGQRTKARSLLSDSDEKITGTKYSRCKPKKSELNKSHSHTHSSSIQMDEISRIGHAEEKTSTSKSKGKKDAPVTPDKSTRTWMQRAWKKIAGGNRISLET